MIGGNMTGYQGEKDYNETGIDEAQAPQINMQLPGPKASALVDLDVQYTSPSYTRMYPLVAKRGKGSVIEDIDGNLFLDFNAGIACCSTGHCHPRVVDAICKQASTLIHYAGTDFYYEPQAHLAKKLSEIAPSDEARKVFFGNTGTEAVEGSLKLARYHTGRKRFIAFQRAFHGRTMGSLALTCSKTTQRKNFFPMMPGVTHVPYGYCYRCAYNLTYPECDLYCVSYIEDQVFQSITDPEEVAAIVVEPIQGEGGYVAPPDDYHKTLKALADKYGILFIADEVQSGMGRTGRMFAMEHYEVSADIITLAKGIGSGMVIGPILARESIMTWKPGSHGNTFGGNPVSCAAVLETISLLEEELIERAAAEGEYFLSQLKKLQEEHHLIGDVRGKGLMIGVELVRDRETREMATKETDDVIQRCFQKGLLTLPCGPNVIRFSPPLVIKREQIDRGLSILDEALSEVESTLGSGS
jgi:4-aminobutyrate aminotransferase